jgi:hypothetical protein
MKRLAFLSIVMTTPASAHAGHVADLAGHAHWLGLGAALGAAALAGLLAGKGKDAPKAEEDAPESEECPA